MTTTTQLPAITTGTRIALTGTVTAITETDIDGIDVYTVRTADGKYESLYLDEFDLIDQDAA